LFFDSVTLDGNQLPADVQDFLTKMNEVQTSQQTLSLTTRELGLLAQAVHGMEGALRRAVRSADNDEQADNLTDMLTDTKVLGRQLEAQIGQAFRDALGADYSSSEVARKLQSVVDSRVGQQGQPEQPAAKFEQNGAYL
jgi:NTP pyrophosphatase (non-canonical NTP hydrolase)